MKDERTKRQPRVLSSFRLYPSGFFRPFSRSQQIGVVVIIALLIALLVYRLLS